MGSLERAERVASALGALFAETRVPVIVVTHDGFFVAANEAAIQQYGWSLAELLEMNIRDLQATRWPNLVADLDRAFHNDRRPLDRRPHKRRDGSVLWVVPTAHSTTIDGETLIVSVLKDVTALLDAEERAREASEISLRDRQLVLNAVVALIGERDDRAGLQGLARSFAQGIGRSTTVWLPAKKGSLVLHPVAWYDLTPDGERAILGVRIDLERERFGRLAWETGVGYAIERDATTPGSVEDVTVKRLDRMGIVAPLMGRDGPQGLVYGTLGDGGDLARAVTLATTLGAFAGVVLESTLLEKRAEVMWHAASEQLSDGIALLDADLRIVRVNSAELRLLGALTSGDVVGKACAEVFQVCAGVGRCPHRVALEDRQRTVTEVIGAFSQRPMRVEIIPVEGDAANVAVIHVVHDLTDERAARTALVSSDRLASIGRLAAGVAHEINNPAAFVTVNLGVLRDRFLSGNARSSDVLAMIEESLNGMDRIRDIVRDLKGLARDRAVEAVDLDAAAQSALRMAAHETRGRARVERTTDGRSFARVRGARVTQVVLNLILNAAQAMPANRAEGRILVRARRVGDRAHLEVADNGPGIDAGIARHVFEPFFTTRERTGGTGLGLWLARSIVEEEGGTLTFHDEPGGGACFVIDLPACPNPDERDSSSHHAAAVRH